MTCQDYSIFLVDLHVFGYLHHSRSHFVNRLVNGMLFCSVANQTNSRVSVKRASSDCKLSFIAGWRVALADCGIVRGNCHTLKLPYISWEHSEVRIYLYTKTAGRNQGTKMHRFYIHVYLVHMVSFIPGWTCIHHRGWGKVCWKPRLPWQWQYSFRKGIWLISNRSRRRCLLDSWVGCNSSSMMCDVFLGFPKIGVPIKMDDLGVPLFQETIL